MPTPSEIRAIAEQLAGNHYVCDDPWYSCPLSSEGLTNPAEHGCTCGYDARLARIVAFVSRTEAIVSAAQAWKDAKRAHDNAHARWATTAYAPNLPGAANIHAAYETALSRYRAAESALLASLETPGAGTGETR